MQKPPISNDFENFAFSPLVGSPPFCGSFRTSIRSARFTRRNDDGTHSQKFIDLGCGKKYLCLNCAKLEQEKKFQHYYSIFKSLLSKFPKLQFVHAVFTLPHDHPLHVEESQSSYRRLQFCVTQTVLKFWPGSGSILVLHNWSSKNPENAHIHIHALIVCVSDKGILLNPWVDIADIKKFYAKILNYSADPVIDLQYYKVNDIPVLKHRILYCCRYPIVDFAEQERDGLTAPYLKRIEHLFGFHRFTHIGWFSNRILKKTLESFGFRKVTRDSIEGWKFDGIYILRYNRFRDCFEDEFHVQVPLNIISQNTIGFLNSWYELDAPFRSGYG